MTSTADKFERMMNLLAALLETPRLLSAEQLQDRIPGYAAEKEAFRRTFERDKDELRKLGVPIQVGPVPGTFPEVEGYRVDRRVYELPELDLEPDEMTSLHLAMQLVRIGGPSSDDGSTAAALWRLGGVAEGASVSKDDRLAAIPVDDRQAVLFRAVVERRVCSFEYTTGAEHALRTVEPWRVGYERGHWYLTGFDRDRDAPRQFRLDRMSETIDLAEPESFSGPMAEIPDSDYRPWDDGSSEQIHALVRVDGDQAHWAVEALGRNTVVSVDPDGSHVFDVPVTAWGPFRSFLLGFLDHAELLEPASLRSELVEWLQGFTTEDN